MDLLERLYADPFDDELRLVVADALQQLGDPQGELAIVQSRLTPALRARHDELVAELCSAEALDLARKDQILGVTWHLGWIRRARVQLAGDDASKVAEQLEHLLTARVSRLVEHLDLIVGHWWPRDVLLEDHLVQLIAHGPYPALRILEVGGFVEQHRDGAWPNRDLSAVYVTNKSWPDHRARICVLADMCKRLEELRIQGNVIEVNTLDLPALRVFELCTSSLGTTSLEALDATTWPALERLVLWFGDCEYGGGDPCVADDVAAFVRNLEGKCPQLRHLALANSMCIDGILDELAATPPRALFERLTGFDVSLGTLGGVDALIALRPMLRGLSVLDVSQNYLAPAEQARLVEAYGGCEVRLGRQNEDPLTERFCAVSE